MPKRKRLVEVWERIQVITQLVSRLVESVGVVGVKCNCPTHSCARQRVHPSSTLPCLSSTMNLQDCPSQPHPRSQLRVEERLVKWMKNFEAAKRCPFAVHNAFLRFYKAGEPGNKFEVHIDDSMYTVVICFPPLRR